MMRHFVDLTDLSTDEVTTVLDLSERVDVPRTLEGRGAALLFEKPSARTRNATEMAVVQLGGHPVTLRGDEVGLDVRESVEDVTRTLAGYHRVLCARVYDHSKLERMAALDMIPVVNLLSDHSHPIQTLADLLTIRQHFGSLAELTVAWIGDWSNVARSLAEGAARCGMRFRCAAPHGYGPSEVELDRLATLGVVVDVTDRPHQAVDAADVVSTDAWYSMGQEDEKALRRKAFEGFTVDASVMSAAAAHAVFLHCLPAHRGDEATDDVLDGPQSLIWQQAANRMHTARGLIAFLTGAVSV
jgi:ornithine carbamoyltransferase